MRRSQSGEIIIVLLLVIVVALGIGLSISTRSINEISTATKTEQSARAFAAAEAGIEQGLTGNLSPISFSANDARVVNVLDTPNIPSASQAFEYPNPIDRSVTAQFWLANPSDLSSYYSQPTLNLYFGEPKALSADSPAAEVIVITLSGGGYKSYRYYFDSNPIVNGVQRITINGFQPCSTPTTPPAGSTKSYLCKASFPPSNICASTPAKCYTAAETQIMARVRLVYSNRAQPLALEPVGSCADKSCFLPPQARIITSTGAAGNVLRKVQLFKQDSVLPPFLDYVLFSGGEIRK